MGISAGPVSCLVYVDDGSQEGVSYAVKLEHYEQLKDMLDRNESGWIELQSIYADGRLLIRLDRISHMFKATSEYCEAREAFNIDEMKKEQVHGA